MQQVEGKPSLTQPSEKLRREITFSEDEDDEIVYKGVDSEEECQGTPAACLLENEKTMKAGYLLKKGERRKTWKKRWFVLRTTKLAYYKDEKEYQLLQIIDMDTIHNVSPVIRKDKQNIFCIVTPQRTYYVQTESKKELEDWMASIMKAKKDFQTEHEDTTTETDEEFAREVGGSYATEPATSTSASATQPLSMHRKQVRLSVGGPNAWDSVSAQDTETPSQSVLSSSPRQPTTSLQKRPVSILKNPTITTPPSSQSPQHHSIQGIHMPSHSSSTTTSTASDSQNSALVETSPPNPPASTHFANTSSKPTSSDLLFPITEQEVLSSGNENDLEGDDVEQETESMDAVGTEGSKNQLNFQGYLWKLGRNKKWKQRWFVLRSDQLCYFKKEKENAPQRKISLETILDSIEIDSMSESRQNCFKVITPQRNYVLCADSEETLENWLDALSVAVRRAKRKGIESWSDWPSGARVPEIASQPGQLGGAGGVEIVQGLEQRIVKSKA